MRSEGQYIHTSCRDSITHSVTDSDKCMGAESQSNKRVWGSHLKWIEESHIIQPVHNVCVFNVV